MSSPPDSTGAEVVSVIAAVAAPPPAAAAAGDAGDDSDADVEPEPVAKRPRRSATSGIDYSKKAQQKKGLSSWSGAPDQPRKKKAQEAEYVVEAIVDKRIDGKGKYKSTEYKVRWKGFSESDDTWESVQDLGNVLNLVGAFEKNLSKEEKKAEPKAKQSAKKSAAKKATKAPKKSTKTEENGPTLMYWNGRGLMEVPRMMLAAKGKFPGKGYTDLRVTTEDLETYGDERASSYESVKDSLGSNLGRMPVLEVEGGGSIGQSAAINYYLATELGLFGSSTLEGAQILSIAEHIRELQAAHRKLIPYGKTPEQAANDQFFGATSAVDFEGAANMATRNDRYMQWYVRRLEGAVGGKGHAVGSKLSLADVLIYNTFAETLLDAELPTGVDMPSWKREPFGDGERTAKALEGCPKLQAIISAVAKQAGIKKHLATRGVQRF